MHVGRHGRGSQHERRFEALTPGGRGRTDPNRAGADLEPFARLVVVEKLAGDRTVRGGDQRVDGVRRVSDEVLERHDEHVAVDARAGFDDPIVGGEHVAMRRSRCVDRGVLKPSSKVNVEAHRYSLSASAENRRPDKPRNLSGHPYLGPGAAAAP